MNWTFLQISQELNAATAELTTKSSKWMDKAIDMSMSYAPKIIGAILIYVIGKFLVNKFVGISRKVFSKRNFDQSLQKFLISLIAVSLNILIFLAIAGILGVNITSFAALLAGAGLAIGAALNGSLGNLAGGVMLMIFKPIKVGDLIEAQGSVGVVNEIGIFCTTLITSDNKTIFLPNGSLSTGTITNFSTQGHLRVDLTMAISFDSNIDQARNVALQALQNTPKVLETPAPEVAVSKVGDGMVTLAVRPHANQEDYWTVYFGAQEMVKKAFDAHGIKGPVPTRMIINQQA